MTDLGSGSRRWLAVSLVAALALMLGGGLWCYAEADHHSHHSIAVAHELDEPAVGHASGESGDHCAVTGLVDAVLAQAGDSPGPLPATSMPRPWLAVLDAHPATSCGRSTSRTPRSPVAQFSLLRI
ncbi:MULTISPECIES: hypothetical protein [Kribbella]|uniref:hypothetical protein n=1 Tax=Kribbella TaxID=182639 RepID=UPI000374AE36|nr:hypothetical protein [Kribbella catacumbae]